MRATALVVAADDPLDNSVPLQKRSRGTVRILVESKPDPIYVARDFRLKKDCWLVPGMEVPVSIDPEQPDRFEVEWDAVPSIEERAAANDPTLADPIGARNKVAEALTSAGLAGPDLEALPGGIGQLAARSQEAEREATPDRLKEAVAKAAQEPAPPGKVRAVVLLATQMVSLVDRGGAEGRGAGHYRDRTGKHDAVLAVNVPGLAPYAVFVRGLKRPGGKAEVAGWPALVSSSDPNDVEVLWDEIASAESQIEQRISDGMQAAAAGMREEMEIGRQMTDALQKASTDPQRTVPPPGTGPVPHLGAGMQQTMAQNAKRALQFVQDPAQRKMLIEQYRAAGIPIDEEDEAP